MWCRHCQFDVPAVARETAGPLYCSNCERQIAEPSASVSAPADTGVDLASYDTSPSDLAPPVDTFESEQTRDRLRQIGRTLQSSYRRDAGIADPSLFRSEWTAAANLSPDPQLRPIVTRTSRASSEESSPTAGSWLVSMLLLGGGASFVVGLGLLVWSASFEMPRVWQWGLATTLASEGSLVLGLVWMAARLWRNSRRLNRQLRGIDCQMNEIHQFTGSLAGSQVSSSQHFYDHFHQSASPQMQMANLRGQVDQLANQMAAGR